MTFVFDLDDTICHTDEYYDKYINEFIKRNNMPIRQVKSVSRYTWDKFDWDAEFANKWFLKYADKMMIDIPCKQNAVSMINSLYDEGNRIVICTARSKKWHSDPQGTTIKWLEKHGVKFNAIYFDRRDKEEVCRVEKADVFIDDDIEITKKVADYFESVGKGRSFLMNSNYNREFPCGEGVERVFDFRDFKQKLEDYIQEERERD